MESVNPLQLVDHLTPAAIGSVGRKDFVYNDNAGTLIFPRDGRYPRFINNSCNKRSRNTVLREAKSCREGLRWRTLFEDPRIFGTPGPDVTYFTTAMTLDGGGSSR